MHKFGFCLPSNPKVRQVREWPINRNGISVAPSISDYEMLEAYALGMVVSMLSALTLRQMILVAVSDPYPALVQRYHGIHQ
jgi:hypothetical protein